MARIITIVIFLSICLLTTAQSKHIKGIVKDETNIPVACANVFIEGTIDGTSTNEDGTFDLETDAEGKVTLKVSFVGYITYAISDNISNFDNLTIILKADQTSLDEVVITASNFTLKGSSTIERKNAVELVTTAGSEGDLYKSIALLPGVQVAGSDGKLLVRGGSSRESQTYIDDMHVMSAYTSMPENVAARGRYSPFIFDGINFSMGGYSSEYSQSLSSVLPLTTKDESAISKTGASITSVGLGGGGTQAWAKGSASVDLSYTNMKPYYSVVYPDEADRMIKPYQNISGRNQLRFNLGAKTVLKTYFSYDKTIFKQEEETPFTEQKRNMDFDEDNLYLNTTFRTRLNSGINYFAGIAYSWNRKQIGDARTLNDFFDVSEKETHLKTKADKRFSNVYKLGIGAESFLKRYDMSYRNTTDFEADISHSINGLFVSNDFNLTHNLILNASSRLEYTTTNKSWAVLPRVALNYEVKGITFSGIVGKYQQAAENDYLLFNNGLKQEATTQYILGMYSNVKNNIIRAELYYKRYNGLTTFDKEIYASDGDGYSRGIDLFYNSTKPIGRKETIEYMLAYSYNDSERKYDNYTEKVMPAYATKHNASVTLKYWNESMKSYIGITNRFASGRPYHDPSKEGFMNSKTPVYNTLDLSWTLLAHKKLIIYACASNILNRKNVYGYNYDTTQSINGMYDRKAIKSQMNQFFFVGFFITLGGKTAYDASNF